jgi:hypothetical protein
MKEPSPGDLLVVRSAGAYGFAMSSNYNTRPRAAEVLVDGARAQVARRRETWADLVRGERPASPLRAARGAGRRGGRGEAGARKSAPRRARG